ncbi:MAG TPA: hypothetical protein VF794_25105 [Archangium sp.]|jgi:hypothetical protein|uniref:hypothetical protein n=1 Tax=Archangium sp. TaxID=1872627 RepID=UPI002ED83DDC
MAPHARELPIVSALARTAELRLLQPAPRGNKASHQGWSVHGDRPEGSGDVGLALAVARRKPHEGDYLT